MFCILYSLPCVISHVCSTLHIIQHLWVIMQYFVYPVSCVTYYAYPYDIWILVMICYLLRTIVHYVSVVISVILKYSLFIICYLRFGTCYWLLTIHGVSCISLGIYTFTVSLVDFLLYVHRIVDVLIYVCYCCCYSSC